MERALVELARTGDADAFDELVRRRIDTVYRTALGILGEPADARDATQEAFISAWRQLPTLRDVDRFDAWLRAITVNACRMALRRRRLVRADDLGWEPPAEGEALRVVLRVHANDPRSAECPAEYRQQCLWATVVEEVVWSAEFP